MDIPQGLFHAAADFLRGSPMLSGPKATSSRTVGMNSWSSACWKTIPTLSRTRATVLGVTGMSPTRTWPEEGGQQAVEVEQQRGFPCAVPAYDGDGFPVGDAQGNAVQRRRRNPGN